MSGAVKNSNQPKAQQAQWNVQVVRGKVTTRCLWNACKALSVGLLLLVIGTTMAVIGYYADQLSVRSETRGNSTVKVKNESRGFHLNNLSYAGPIVMGIGGFIVVAACVMTFEARDSAAKVVPARFKPNLSTSISEETTKTTPRTCRTFPRLESKRAASMQTTSGGRCPESFKLEPPGLREGDRSPKNDPAGRKAFTAAFVQFSRELVENSATFEGSRRWRQKMGEGNLNKSPSAPDLTVTNSGSSSLDPKLSGRLCRGSPKCGSRCQRESARPLETVSSNILLRPGYLQRQAFSMDNPFDDSCETCTPPSMRLSRQQSRCSGGSRDSFEMGLGCSAGVSGSQVSMTLDLHDCQVTLKVKDESANKRSETARRHQLLRQKPVEDDVVPRCSHVPRFLCAATGEEGRVRTNSSTNLQTACHHSLRKTGSCSGRTHIPKMTADYRSQSFSHTCSLKDPRKCTFHEFNPKVFYVEDHRRTNLSSENVRICCEEKLRYLMRRSPGVSPQKSPRTECGALRLEGSECPLHSTKELPSRKKRKGNRKIEGSLSAEEQHNGRRKTNHGRSASFSPTRQTSATTMSSREESSSPGKQSRSLVAATAADEEKRKKFEAEEPS